MTGVTIHPLAVVHETAILGPGTVVWSGAVVGSGARLGPNCAVGSCAYVGRDARLGASVRMQHGVFLPNRSQIGDYVFIGPNATFTDDRHPKVNHPVYQAEPPVVHDHANIGAGAVILPGVTIGHGATVGAGAVVVRDVEAWDVVVGNPARSIQVWV